MIKNQVEILPWELENPDLRDRMMDEILKIHYSKNLKNEILHVGISIIDRYLSKFSISEDQYLLIGVTCLWIANKIISKKPKPLERWLKHIP